LTTNLCVAANCPVEVRLLPLQLNFSHVSVIAPVIFITGFFLPLTFQNRLTAPRNTVWHFF
jgi:hypothetical protein